MVKNMGFIVSGLMVFAIVGVLILYPTEFDFVSEYIYLIPSILLIFVCIYGTKEAAGATLTGAYLALGCAFAYFTASLNDAGILIPDLLTASMPLKYLQLLIIVLFGMVGAVLSPEDS